MKRFSFIFALSGLVLIIDQAAKFLVKRTMHLNQSIRVIGEDFFRLTYVENEGIAFGIYFGGRLFLIFFTLIAVLFLIYYIIRLQKSPLMPKIALSLILGGALGNLSDRIFRGTVVDFFDFDFPDFIMVRWPVFNVADSSVSIGMTILIICLLFYTPEISAATTEGKDEISVGGNEFSSLSESDEGKD